MSGSGEVESDLFLSAAHGNLENVENLLSSGRVSISISLDINRDEFSASIQTLLKQAVCHVLGSDTCAHESDLSIVSVSDDIPGMGEGKGARQSDSCIAISMSIKASNGTDADDIKCKMERPGFLKKIGDFLEERVRTVTWNPRLVSVPQAVKYGADDRDKIGCSAMHWAALNDRCDIISALSRHKADVNVTGNDGHTPLHWAALKGHVRAVSLLLKIGAKKDAADNWDFTPLIRASQNGHLFVVLLLLQEGADPTMVDNERHNALHWAVYHRHHLVASWLLKDPRVVAGVNALDSKGATALHLAARKSGREMMRKLLAAGADGSIEDAEGHSAENVAINAKRIPNAQFMACWRRTPTAIRFMMVQRGENNRAYSIIPTFHGALAMACIALAYIYWAAVLIPRTWEVLPVTHAFLIIFTIPMYYCYYKSWKGDPGTILPQPEQVIQGFISEELAMEDIIMVAMSPKYPRAKYSRYFDCYVARFDHDCPWISNVVGAGNHAYFMGFCFTCSICLSIWDYICIYMIGMTGHLLANHNCGEGARICPRTSDVAIMGLANEKIALIMLMIYIFYAFFTWCMSFSQLRQVATNVTTNEMINWHRYAGWTKEDGSFVNPYDRGVLYNMKQFLAMYPTCPRGKTTLQEARYAEMATLLKAGSRGEQGGEEGEVVIEMQGIGRGGEEDAGGDEDDDKLKQQLRDIGFDDV